MKEYIIYNWKSGELMDWQLNAVNIDEVEIYDDYDYAKDEIESRGEPFCKVIELSELKSELEKTEAYNKLGGISLYSLKYGDKYKVLQKGWEDRGVFVFQPQKNNPAGRINLYKIDGGEVNISEKIAHALKVEIVK